jgi:carbamate kinase
VEASVLLILTDVAGVQRGYGTEHAEALSRLSADESRELTLAGELGEGSIGPKVQAAASFVESGGERAVIAALEDANRALAGEAGTTVFP